MIFKKILIFVLLFSCTWALNSNDDPRNNDEINLENDDDVLSSSDESDNGKWELIIYRIL